MQEKKQTKSVIKKYGCGCFITTILLLVILGLAFPPFFISLFLYFYMELFLPLFINTSTYLETDNLTLIETQICDRQWYLDYYNQTGILYEDPRFASFVAEKNETKMIHNSLQEEILISADIKFLVLFQEDRFRKEGTHKGQQRTMFLECYQIMKDEENPKASVATKFLGSIDTNRYFALGGSEHRISISSDGKYLLTPVQGKNTKDLPKKHRKQQLFLIWQIGENIIEKDILDATGNKIPIRIVPKEKENVFDRF